MTTTVKWLWTPARTHRMEKPPWLLSYRSSETFIVATISLAVMTDMFLYGVLVPVIPFAIQTRSHVEHGKVQYWVSVLVAIYGASLLAFSPICGWLADRTSSRRSPLLIGLFALLGSTVLLNVGKSVEILIVGRILQGISAAVVWVVGLALLADTIPQVRLAQAVGWVTLGMSLGILISPLLGGIVFDKAGYDTVFGMTYALIGLDIILRLLLIEKKVAAKWLTPTNPPELTTDNGSGPARDVALDRPGDANQSLDVEKRFAAATGAVASDAVVQDSVRGQRRDQLPPVLSLLGSRRLLAVLFCSLMQAALVTAFDSVLAIHAAKIFRWTSTGAGLLFLALVIPTFLAPLVGWISDKYGGRYLVVVGFLFASPPLVCLRFVDENSTQDKVLICALLAITGLSLTLTFPPIMAEISDIVAAKEKSMLARRHPGFGPGGAYAQAYALFNVAYAGGCMVGPLLAGFVVENRGWATMAWVLGLLSGVTAIPAYFGFGG